MVAQCAISMSGGIGHGAGCTKFKTMNGFKVRGGHRVIFTLGLNRLAEEILGRRIIAPCHRGEARIVEDGWPVRGAGAFGRARIIALHGVVATQPTGADVREQR